MTALPTPPAPPGPLEAPFSRLDPHVPLLLLPARVETRYRLAAQPPQLCVRIYPDVVQVDPTRQPNQAALLPAQWVVAGYDDGGRALFVRGSRPVRDRLAVAPDAAASAVSVTDTGLQVDQSLAWMIDYDAAVKAGMAVTIDLAGDAAAAIDGISTLLVLGVDADREPDATRTELARLLAGHADCGQLSFLAQGTPTNNIASVRSPWPDQTGGAPSAAGAGTPPPGPDLDVPARGASAQSQGARFDRLLGLGSPARWQRLPGALDEEYENSRAMRTVLFEAVFGTLLRDLLDVGADDGLAAATVAAARDWFTDQVSGGAPVPCVRVGRQPYGILPVQRTNPLPNSTSALGWVEQVVARLAGTWQLASGLVPLMDPNATDAAGDAGHTGDLATILATQPHPGRLFLRGVSAYEPAILATPQFWYAFCLTMLDPANPGVSSPFREVGLLWNMVNLDRETPTTVEEQLARWEQVRLGLPAWLDSMGVSDPDGEAERAVESTEGVLRAYQTRTSPLSSFPLQVFDSALGEPNNEVLQAAYDPTVTEWGDDALVEAPDAAAGSRAADYLADLSRRVSARDGGTLPPPGLDQAFLHDPPLLYQLIDRTLPQLPAGQDVTAGTVAALDRLAGLDSGSLEWLLRETLGLGAHRLDAWHTSAAAHQLSQLRAATGTGLAVGSFGWVTNLSPRSVSSPSQGFLLAPSLGQAATAAVLRAGYQAHQADDPQSAFAVSMTSSRVRDAQWLLDGIRTDQPLSALLGYHVERFLHDARHDEEIRPLRKAVLVASGQPEAEPDAPVDGIALLDLWRAGRLLHLDPAAVTALRDLQATFDAVQDVGLVEAVHQLTQGNNARAAAVLDTLALGTQPPPDLRAPRTPRHGTSVEHRVIALWPTTLPPAATGWAADKVSALAPGLDSLVAAVLPDPRDVGFAVRTVAADSAPGEWQPLRLDAVGLSALAALVLTGDDPARPGATLTTLVACLLGGGQVELDSGNAGQAQVSLAEWIVATAELHRALAGARPADARDLVPTAAAGTPGTDDGPAVSAAAALAGALTEAIDALDSAVSTAVSTATTGTAWRMALLDATAALARLGVAVPGPAGDAAAGQALLDEARRRADQVDAVSATDLDGWRRRVAVLLRKAVPLVPAFVLGADGSDPILPMPGLAAPDDVDAWFDAVSRVRPDAGRLGEALALAGLLAPDRAAQLGVGQAPLVTEPGGSEGWCATTRPADGAGSRTNIVHVLPAGMTLRAGDQVGGLVVDQWSELVPAATEVAGLTFHFDAPSNRPPQSWLLAVPPPDTAWSFDLVVATLLQTLDWTRYRAVAVEDLGDFGRVVPSVFVPGTVKPWSGAQSGPAGGGNASEGRPSGGGPSGGGHSHG